MACYYCYWGWPKVIADIYNKALKKLEGDELPLNYGPAHIVWDDENFDQAEWCLENFDKYTEGFSEDELAIVKESLLELSNVPMEIREYIPDDYDDEHPENYPPAKEMEFVKILEFSYA